MRVRTMHCNEHEKKRGGQSLDLREERNGDWKGRGREGGLVKATAGR